MEDEMRALVLIDSRLLIGVVLRGIGPGSPISYVSWDTGSGSRYSTPDAKLAVLKHVLASLDCRGCRRSRAVCSMPRLAQFACSCRDSWQGTAPNCDTPRPGCRSSPCDASASCADTGENLHGYKCTCRTGFLGRGLARLRFRWVAPGANASNGTAPAVAVGELRLGGPRGVRALHLEHAQPGGRALVACSRARCEANATECVFNALAGTWALRNASFASRSRYFLEARGVNLCGSVLSLRVMQPPRAVGALLSTQQLAAAGYSTAPQAQAAGVLQAGALVHMVRAERLAQVFDGCVDVDDCASNPCRNGGACIDLVDGYKCNCTDFYTSTWCEVKRFCASSPCQHGGSCLESSGRSQSGAGAQSVLGARNDAVSSRGTTCADVLGSVWQSFVATTQGSLDRVDVFNTKRRDLAC